MRFDDNEAVGRLRRHVLPTLDDERALSLYVVLVDRASACRAWSWGGARLFVDLNRRLLPWTAGDVQLLFALTIDAAYPTDITVLKAAAAAAEQLDPAERTDCVDSFQQALRQVDAGWYDSGDRARLRLRLRALIESVSPSTPGKVQTGVIHVEDGWSRVAVERLSAVTADVDVVSNLLAHTGTIPAGPRPSKTWLKRTGELLADRPRVVALVRELLELAHTCEPAEVESWGFQFPQRIGPNNADLARGLLWAAAASGEPWLTPLVLALHASGPEPKVLNTCIAVLGRRGDAAAIAGLVQLQRTTRDRGELTQIATALDEAAAAAGISRSELTEQTISDAGLDRQGKRRIVHGDVTAVLAIDEPAKVTLVWEHDGRRSVRPPAHVDPDLVRALKRDTAELRKLIASERDRLEDLLVEDREWPLDTWRQRYAHHPVTGSLANRLLWLVTDAGRSVAALPAADGRFTLANGDVIDPSDHARVRVWHPATADPDEVRAWRAHILARELTQPFKQAFREVYLLTPAEEETRIYSNRFAAHVLRYQQTYALMKQRRWATNYLGGWDGGYDGEAKRDFPSHGLRAVFFHQPAGDEDGHTVQYCTTDQVRFQRLRGRDREPVPLADVPPVVFSEAMRDVDLFIGVASIATDPTWFDRGADRHFAYWQSVAFGDLSANGQIRRHVIEHLLPKLKIRDRARLDGNYLVVNGQKRTYRIHVGSGNILMSPNDQYLCIVPARATKPTGVRFLPFEGDDMLAVVLSKALLLADDHRITDPSIVHQIR
ncbi:DUF4132 domain-containing protein [Micromonospora sp. NPDC047707]|uniref:DUF4132 domain-containing protein n=1 Tax=Micromonospora sp. NPDC047707 TaxID=3154498 RepID=UPI003454FB6F